MFIFLLTLFSAVTFADSYHRPPELEAELKKIAAENPGFVNLETAGTSFEGRPITVATLGSGPSILVVGGTHARERIAFELPLRLIRRLIAARDMLSGFSVRVLPLQNPDGVTYDFSDSGKMSWRKNRRPVGEGAIGVDLNRNYGYGWGNDGASSSPFSDIFKGPAPFSEPETRAVRDYISAHPDIRLVVNYHSFGEQVFYPWGSKYSPIENPTLRKLHYDLAEGYAKLTGYTAMQSSAPGPVTGDICDWSLGEKNIPCLAVELDPKEHINYGHYLPESEIERVVNRNWDAFLFLIKSLK